MRIVVLFFLLNNFFLNSTSSVFIFPNGDSKTPGRVVGTQYERTLTASWAAELRASFDTNALIISHEPGVVCSAYRAAERANQEKAKTTLILNAVEEQDPQLRVYIYYYSQNNDLDTLLIHKHNPFLIPFTETYLQSFEKSKLIAHQIKEALSAENGLIEVLGPFGIPAQQLLGFCMPSVLCEIGINEKTPKVLIKQTVHIIATSLINCMEYSG